MGSGANNFDLIRLAAAMQVALYHSATHLNIDLHDSLLFSVASLFPGVPIFFFISGFLISKSWERNPQLVDYVPNRILRIYPGLFVCFWVSVSSVFLAGYFESMEVSVPDLIPWIAAQLTIGQFYNPEFMQLYGVGVLNGSLWTIPVELQFYIVVPVLYFFGRRRFSSSSLSNSLLGVLVLAFLVLNRFFIDGGVIYADHLWYKLVGVSFAPWIYIFLLGIVFQRNFDFFHQWLSGRFFAFSRPTWPWHFSHVDISGGVSGIRLILLR